MVAPGVPRAEARLRRKNQLTLPEPIADHLGARPRDVLIFEADSEDPDVVRVRLIPHSFAGALTGVFGSTDETAAFVRAEREAWREQD